MSRKMSFRERLQRRLKYYRTAPSKEKMLWGTYIVMVILMALTYLSMSGVKHGHV